MSMDPFNQMSRELYDEPWKHHQNQIWLESVLKQLYQKYTTVVEDIKEVDVNGLEKIKAGKEKWRKIKFRSFPVRGRQKSRVKGPLVRVVDPAENEHGKENRIEDPPPKVLPEAEKFWKYVDKCYEQSVNPSNVRETKKAAQKEENVTEAKQDVTEAKQDVTEAKQDVTEAKQDVTEAKKDVTKAKRVKKLRRRRKKRVKKQKSSSKYRCFARTRPGFLTSLITEPTFFYPIVLGKRVINVDPKDFIRSQSTHISEADTETNVVEQVKPKLKLNLHPEPKVPEPKVPEPKVAKRKVAKRKVAKPEVAKPKVAKPKPKMPLKSILKPPSKPQRWSTRISNAEKKRVSIVEPETQQYKASKPKRKRKRKKKEMRFESQAKGVGVKEKDEQKSQLVDPNINVNVSNV